MTFWTEMWRFETARCAVIFDVAPDDDGEVRENLASGFWTAFRSRVRVLIDGEERGADYLDGSIYENPSDFIDHRGIASTGCGSYFSDMVREAIREARKATAAAPAPLRLRELNA